MIKQKTKNIKACLISDIHDIYAYTQKFIKVRSDAEIVFLAGDISDNLDYQHWAEAYVLGTKNEDLNKKEYDRLKKRSCLQGTAHFLYKSLPIMFPKAKVIVAIRGNHDEFKWNEVNEYRPEDSPDMPKIDYYLLSGMGFLSLPKYNLHIAYSDAITYLYEWLSSEPPKSVAQRLTSEELFHYDMSLALKDYMEDIAVNIADIVLTHVPPYGTKWKTVLGKDIGSKALRFLSEDYLDEARYFLFGHMHVDSSDPKDHVEYNINSRGTFQQFINGAVMKDKEYMQLNGYGTEFVISKPLSKKSYKKWINTYMALENLKNKLESFGTNQDKKAFLPILDDIIYKAPLIKNLDSYIKENHSNTIEEIK